MIEIVLRKIRENDMKQIVILFPGIGYHCDKPLLYYGRKVAMECGYCDVRNISYSYDGAGNIRGDNEKINAVFKVLYEQAKEELKEINWVTKLLQLI